MTLSSPSTGVRPRIPAARRRRTARLLAVLRAAAGVAVLWMAAVPVAGLNLAVHMGGRTQPITLASVVGASVLAGLLGWGLLAALETRIRRAATIWTAVALTVVVLSLGGPLTSAASLPAAAVLAGMHLLVAAVVVLVLRRTSASR